MSETESLHARAGCGGQGALFVLQFAIAGGCVVSVMEIEWRRSGNAGKIAAFRGNGSASCVRASIDRRRL